MDIVGRCQLQGGDTFAASGLAAVQPDAPWDVSGTGQVETRCPSATLVAEEMEDCASKGLGRGQERMYFLESLDLVFKAPQVVLMTTY